MLQEKQNRKANSSPGNGKVHCLVLAGLPAFMHICAISAQKALERVF